MIHPALLALVVASAQQGPQPETPPRQLVLVDTVVATVNDSAIMHSEILTLTAGEIRSLEARGARLLPQDQRRIYMNELEKRIDHHTWAQAAKTFGVASPAQVEDLLQRALEREEQDQVRDLGSYQAFSRALQNQGRTWPTYVREQRVDRMAEFAQQFSIGMRLQRQANLYVTPRMLRETYEREKQQFVHGAEARVALVVFRGPDAAANATQAAAVWREEDLSSRALAQRFPNAVALDNTVATSLIPELATFALAGPAGHVSAPIPRDGIVQLAKILDYRPARNATFEDLDVQDKLRSICQHGVVEEFRLQALQRAHQRTEVWRAKLPR